MKKALKISLWVVMAIALLIVGTLVSTVRLLRAERLTPLSIEVANKVLNADVDIARVSLHVRKSFPFIDLHIDSLTIISRDMLQLPQAARDTISASADTLLRIDHLQGGINLPRLLAGAISLNDVVIDGPMANIVVVNDSINNFAIGGSTDDVKKEKKDNDLMPDIRIKSFKIINPKKLSYTDLATGTYLQAKLRTADLIGNSEPPLETPVYHIDLDTNISSPVLANFGMQSMPIGLDGTIEWDHRWPMAIALSDFNYALSSITGKLHCALDFSDDLIVKELGLTVNPVSVSEVLEILPVELCHEYSIPRDITTNAQVGIDLQLLAPYEMGTTLIPHAKVNMRMPDSELRWGKMDLKHMELDIDAVVQGVNLNQAYMDIKKLTIAGPATEIDVAGRISNCITDPCFDGRLDGYVVLDRLPPVVSRLIDNAYTSGKITLHTDIMATQSMLSREKFHLLQIAGDIKLQDIYYLASDTLSMFYAKSGLLKFGTNERLEQQTRRGIRHLDSLLTASVDIDSARILVSGLDMRAKGFKLSVHALNNNDTSSDTTAIIPMGGQLSTSSFSLFTISDSAGMRLRDLSGQVSMQRYQGDTHLPLFRLKAGIGRISTGDNNTRFMMSNGQLNVSLNKLPLSQLSTERQRVKHLADSIMRVKPDIPIDSVYHMAMLIRRREGAHRKGHRVHAEMTPQEQEIIDWGVTPTFKRFLTDWRIRGSFSAERAGLFTAAFPLRNRVRNLNARFNNDSIVLSNVQYKAGNSDFTLSGSVTNMVKAFTGRQGRNPIKVNLALLSDTIDVNQLSHAFFTGAAHSDKPLRLDTDDENALERMITDSNDSTATGPLLIPINLDAEFSIKANTVLYSDFVLNDLRGTILAYDGALNLHDLSASSAVGALQLSALYAAPTPKDMKFGFGMDLQRFNIHHFLNLVPAIDSVLPMMRDLGGIIDAKIAATADVDSNMNLLIPTLHAAVNLQGDSIAFLDSLTFKKVAKWLLFRNKEENMIKHMNVDLIVEDNTMRLFPFVFDFDRYRIGVQGYNDLDMNFDYHIAILKSPIPFKFGINIRGSGDKYKIRLGRARFKENQAVENVSIADTTRVNLINQFENVFKRGVRNSNFAQVKLDRRPEAVSIDLDTDTISAADSLYFRQQGLLPPLTNADSIAGKTEH